MSETSDTAAFHFPASVSGVGVGWYGDELQVEDAWVMKDRPAPPLRAFRPFRWEPSSVTALREEHSAIDQPQQPWLMSHWAPPCLPHLPGQASDYQVFMRQLLPRGFNYEPAATGLAGADGTWRAFETPYIESVDEQQLFETVEAAVVTGQSATVPSAVSLSAVSAVWHEVAAVQPRLTPFGLPSLSADSELLGFLRLGFDRWRGDAPWIGPGEKERPRYTNDMFMQEMQQGTARTLHLTVGFLPLTALQRHVLPALTAADAEQGAIAISYMQSLQQLLTDRRVRGELTPEKLNVPGYHQPRGQSLFVGHRALSHYIQAVGPTVFPVSGLNLDGLHWQPHQSAQAPATPTVLPNAQATAAALFLFRSADFEQGSSKYEQAVEVVRQGRLEQIQADYLKAHPFVLDPARHAPHVLELLGGRQDAYKCDVCEKHGSGPRYACRRCNFDTHPACITDGAQSMKKQQGKKRRMEEQQAEQTGSTKPRGPFFVFSVYYKHGEYGMSQLADETQLRTACKEELREMKEEQGEEEEEEDEDDEESEGGRAAELDAMSVDDLVALVLRSTGDGERYNWRVVIEGGRQMRDT